MACGHGLTPYDRRHQRRDVTGLVDHVGIGKDQDGPGGLPRPDVARRPQTAVGLPQDVEPQPLADARRLIPRPIVDHDDLQWAKVLLQEGQEALPHAMGLVVYGHDGADGHVSDGTPAGPSGCRHRGRLGHRRRLHSR